MVARVKLPMDALFEAANDPQAADPLGALNAALVACLRELIRWLPAASGITAAEAYAVASMAVSFRVTQFAHQTGPAYDTAPPKAVHAVIDKRLFSAAQRARVESWLRPAA